MAAGTATSVIGTLPCQGRSAERIRRYTITLQRSTHAPWIQNFPDHLDVRRHREAPRSGKPDGLSENGLSVNGIRKNGIQLNGIQLNGMSLTRLAFNGTQARTQLSGIPLESVGIR